MRIGWLFTAILTCAVLGFGQAPAITPGGVVNAASWSTPLVPGEMIAIFGTNLAAGQQSADPPLPNSLGGSSVTINGVAAPLAFVSTAQINAQVPSSLTANTIGTAAVVVTTAAGSSASALAALGPGAPGLFTADGSGCGQAAALNIRPDGSVSPNSPSNSAAPGDYVVLFGTGFGLAGQQPPDGAATSGAVSLRTYPGLFLDGNPLASLAYDGLAPALVGVDQINFQIPASTRNGCAVPVSASQGLGSPSVTLSVQSGRGQCSDPPAQSWGQILLSVAQFSGPISTVAFFSASFPSGPNARPPASEAIVYAPDWVGNVPQLGGIFVSAEPVEVRSCAVPGYSSLSTGAIQVQGPTGNPFNVPPLALQSGGVTYSSTLPAGFLVPGAYTISGTAGNSVALNAKMVVGSPIQIQSSFPPGTVISSGQPLTVQWTGGDSGSLVRVALSVQLLGGATNESYSYANASSGSLTISPFCTGPSPDSFGTSTCSFGLPHSNNAQITVEVLPNPATAQTIAVPGITGLVQLNWQYSYDFGALVLGQ